MSFVSATSSGRDPTGPQIGARTVAQFVDALASMGADVPLILARAGLSEAEFRNPEARISADKATAFVSAAIEVTGDEDLGLHLGERSDPAHIGVVGYLLRASTNAREAVDQVQRYGRLIADGLQIELREKGDHIVLAQRFEGYVPHHRMASEFVLTFIHVSAWKIAGEAFRPVEVHFTHPTPEQTREHERIFAAPVRFGMAENALIFPSWSHMSLSATADAELSAILARHAQHLLEQLPPVNDFVAQVRRLIAKELAGGNPSAEHIAARLHMSARTLRRRLQEHGAQHKLLLDELRRELAIRYLSEERLEIAEVAFLLSFSEASAFHRAFKRWTGRTPSDYRESRGA